MYIPKEFQENDLERVKELIDANPFGMLCNSSQNGVEITHLPFVWNEGGKELLSHLAILNTQSQIENGSKVKVVFAGPHAYISPSLYNSARSVPTWNYLAAHISGTIEYLDSPADVRMVMEAMIRCFEPSYMHVWENLPEKYLSGMFTQLRAFRIPIEKVEAVAKLSQNKSDEERHRIAQHLLQSEPGQVRDTGFWMQAYLDGLNT